MSQKASLFRALGLAAALFAAPALGADLPRGGECAFPPVTKYQYDTKPGADAAKPILFGQIGASPRFSKEGAFKGADVAEIADDIKAGRRKPQDFRIQYIWVNGERVAVNNRSLTVLSKAGQKPAQVEDMTGRLPRSGPDCLQSVLRRLDEMGGKPSRSIGLRDVYGRDSKIRETVEIAP